MPAAAIDLSRLLDEAFYDEAFYDEEFYPPTRQRRRAVYTLIVMAKSPNTSQVNLRQIGERLCENLPGYSGESYSSNYERAHYICSLPPAIMIAAGHRRRVMLRMLYRPLVDALAANPNTPPDTLSEIAYYSPRVFCSNPMVARIAQEQPEWIETLSGETLHEHRNATLMRLLRCENAPRPFVERIATTQIEEDKHFPLVAEEARMHIALAGESATDEWKAAVTDYWRQYADTASEQERELHRELSIAGLLPGWALGDTSPEARTRFRHAANPQIPAEERRELAMNDSSIAIRLAAILSPGTSEIERKHALAETFMIDCRTCFVPVTRKNGLPRTAEGAILLAQAILLQARAAPDTFSRQRLAAFVHVRFSPSLIPNSQKSQAHGEAWYLLIAWILGIRPREHGSWSPAQQSGLSALAHDGNRWVRAAARARLSSGE